MEPSQVNLESAMLHVSTVDQKDKTLAVESSFHVITVDFKLKQEHH